jgi:hypothetical protein
MAVTTKQLIANRKNAKKGGVRTDKGKKISKMNSLKHAILSESMFLPGDDAEVLADIIMSLHDELRPQGQLEEFMVDRIISCTWRLQRVIQAETFEILRYYKDYMSDTPKTPIPIQKRQAENSFFNNSCSDTFLRYETTIERQLYRALNALIELRIMRAKYKEIGMTTKETPIKPQIIKKIAKRTHFVRTVNLILGR